MIPWTNPQEFQPLSRLSSLFLIRPVTLSKLDNIQSLINLAGRTLSGVGYGVTHAKA